jgi:cobalt-zinc-cadmium efflux system protein
MATVLNVGLVALQTVYGILAHSTALLADASHNLGDALGLVLAWGAYIMARRHPTEDYTYGLRPASILTALLNAIILLVVTGAIAWEAIERWLAPAPVAGVVVMTVAALAMLINGIAAWLLRGHGHDLNVRGAFLHLVADAAVSLGVVAAGGAILLTGWYWIDPAASLIISVAIVWRTWDLLRDSLNMALQAVPSGIEAAEVKSYLEHLPGVAELHDLHIWPMSTTETALTCHLVMPDGHPGDAFLVQTATALRERFSIAHPTLQIETSKDTICALASDQVV